MRRIEYLELMTKIVIITALLGFIPQFGLAQASFQKLNVNSASKEQLMTLPGVGEKLAMRIVSHREGRGRFASLDDLLLVKGIQPKLLSDLSGKVQVRRDEHPIKKAQTHTQSLEALLKQFEKEPKVSEVQNKALSYASVEPGRIQEWLRRTRIAPALPSFSLSTGQALDSGESVREKFGDPSVVSKKDSSDFKVNLKVEWKFSDLIFNRNELYVARESFRMSVIRERIISDVTKTYIQRHREMLSMAKASSLSDLERTEIDLKVQELTAILDGLTGGWFSEATRNS